MSPQKVLLTGATGYIGGEILAHLTAFNSPEKKVYITAFVRKQGDADKLKAAYPGQFMTVVGTDGYTDPAFISAVTDADIIIHVGNAADDPVSADAISTNIKDGALLIHTSGSYVLTDFSKIDVLDSTKIDDLADIKKINSLPAQQPHRDIDIKILDIHKNRPKVNTVIVCPPLIYGSSKSVGHKVSIQTPLLIKIAAIAKSNKVFGTGNAVWSNIHVSDLAELYVTILAAYLADPSKVAVNENGYYFAASGQHRWGDLIGALDAPLVKYGVIGKDQTSKANTPEENKWTADTFTILGEKSGYVFDLFRSNSITEPTRAKKLGWKATEADLFSTLDSAVKAFSEGLE
ncbi:uncharacterized protein V2V93DRAFT_110320 [Kockiozyma suomiensis]|uniref:uncharacterized protein n=1 Tax=Kockiozyma suomiensis TaxID=1337062 RepID=UPI0033439306